MPKLFTISVGIEEIAVGRVMRLLHKTPGVARVDLDMDSPKLNGRKGPNGRELVLERLKKGPAKFADFSQIFEANGKSPKGLGSCLDTLKKKRLITRKGREYSLRSVS